MAAMFVSSPELGSFERLYLKAARKCFNQGAVIYVMTNNRDPVHFPREERKYKIGSKRWNGSGPGELIESFTDVINDFSSWLASEGYNHKPDHYRASRYRFSYWIKIE